MNVISSGAFLRAIKTAGLILAATTVLNAAAQAEIESYSLSSTKELTLHDWTHEFNLAKFDITKGTLLKVEITIGSAATTVISVTNTGGSATVGDVNTRITLTLTTGGLFIAPNLQYFVPSTEAEFSLAGESSTELGPFAGNASSSFSFDQSADLAKFNGPGTVDLRLGTQTRTTVSYVGGNAAATQVTQGSGTVTVKYTYDNSSAIPEPSTWAALAMGGGLLVASSRFRRRA